MCTSIDHLDPRLQMQSQTCLYVIIFLSINIVSKILIIVYVTQGSPGDKRPPPPGGAPREPPKAPPKVAASLAASNAAPPTGQQSDIKQQIQSNNADDINANGIEPPEAGTGVNRRPPPPKPGQVITGANQSAPDDPNAPPKPPGRPPPNNAGKIYVMT